MAGKLLSPCTVGFFFASLSFCLSTVCAVWRFCERLCENMDSCVIQIRLTGGRLFGERHVGYVTEGPWRV